MKAILKRTFCIALSLTLLISTLAFAGEINAVVERTQEGDKIIQSIVVTGDVDKYAEGEYATVKIFKNGLDEKTMSFDDYNYIGQALIEEGKVNFNCEFNEAKGEYKVVVTTNNEKYPTTISVSDLQPIIDLIDDLNNESITAEEIVDYISTNNSDLSFDTTVYGNLSKDAKKNVWDNAIAENGNEFNINTIYPSFDIYSLLEAIKTADSSSVVKNAVEHYNGKYLNLEELYVNDQFEAMTSTEKNTVYSLMASSNLDSIEAVKEKYTESVILSRYKNVANYLNVFEVLDDNKEYMGIESEVSELSALSSKQKKAAYLYLADERNKVDSLDDLKDKISYALDNISALVKKYSSDDDKGGSSSGGGGSSNVHIGQGFVPQGSTSGTQYVMNFTDVANVPWASEAINTLFAKGIIAGRENGKFVPDGTVTRAEIAKMVTASQGIYNDNADCSFLDAKNHWSYKYVASAAGKGYIFGRNENEFGVDLSITREDTAVIVYRIIQFNALSTKVENITKTFTDLDSASEYARNSILMLAEYGVINGFEDGSFKPQETLTRAEAAVIINNMLKFMNN